MSEFIITCPTPACGKQLRLPADAVGKPLTCPHCRTPLKVTLGPDGTPARVTAPDRLLRIPRMLMVPGFALLIIGVAGTFANGYIAWDCYQRPGADAEHAARYVREFRNLDATFNSNKTRKKDDDASEHEMFMAAAGGAAGATVLIGYDNEVAAAWTPAMKPVHAVSVAVCLIVALGGTCILRGKGYGFALFACVAAMLNVNQACCVPGGIAGLWGVLVLVRDDGRLHFGIRPRK